MKKLFAWAVTAALVLSLGATGVFAVCGGGCHKGNRCACGLGYVDQDGDGVCDNCLALGRTGRVSAAACGGCGRYYVDQNGDGVCDNCPSGGVCQNAGGSHHHRQSCRR